LAELKQLKINLNEIKRILLTHGDIDHIGNLKPLQEVVQALVYADANELPYLAKQKHYSFRKTLFKLLLHIPKFKNIQPLPDNQIGEIKIIRTPGHTPGHVCYVYKEYLFAGDLFNTREGQITLMDDKYTYDKSQSINSIKLLDVKNIKYLCPAHGNVIEVQPS
jgi:glyoxylase-like metal-dependent hydrolase (beta-lactamase superfamily II)